MSQHQLDNTYGLAEIQGQLLEIMKFIHELCVKNDIQYSLTGGSLLGAIRGGGFIPWDDDFDIMMDRENHEKFLAVMRAYEGDDFLLEADQWVYRVRKESRVYDYVASIDLFVLDRVPESSLANKLQVLSLRVIQGMLRDNRKMGDFSLFYRLCIWGTSVLGKLFNKDKLLVKYDKISRKGNSGNGKQLSIFNDRFKLLSIKYDESLMESYELHDFEDTQFMITAKYHDYLTLQFGDYMQLPPEEDRKPMHI